MRHITLFFILFSLLFFQKNNAAAKVDSTTYYSRLAISNSNTNKYRDAFTYTQKAIDFAKANKDIKGEAEQTFRLGKLYFDVKKYEDAIDTFKKSIALFKKLSPSSAKAETYYTLGLCYMRNKDISKAQKCFGKSETLYKSIKKTSQSIDLLNLQKGIIQKSKGNFEYASTIFKLISNKKIDSNQLNIKTEALYQLGMIALERNRNDVALNYFKSALNLNSKKPNLELKSSILLAMSTVYEKKLNENYAYYFLKAHINIEKDITHLDNKKLSLDDYENFKETEQLKKQTEINKENIQKEKTSKFSKLISILAISLISILSLLSLSLFKNNVIRTRSNKLLEEKNQELILAKEKAEKASNARTEFLSTVSHELRTPLNAINGITHLLLEEKPKKTQMQYLKSLQFSANYLTLFINDILEINKIDSKKLQLENINFDLKILLENIQHSLKELATENNNTFTIQIDSEIPDSLIGDPTKLSQVLINLINNSLKFTHNGEVIVSTKLLSSEKDNAIIYFEVKDNGIGIPEDKLISVFDSFSQGSIGINRKYGGTGLGLTIVRKLVRILGGKINLESTVGKGSVFSFSLPFTVENKAILINKKTVKKKDAVLKNKKILIVEDNKINQMISKKMLENKGVICQIVDNGEDAIEIVRNNEFDLILMDVHLPGINGTIATRKIREFDKKIPIIALTAISLNENRSMLLEFGINDVITKPFIPEDFYNIISKHL